MQEVFGRSDAPTECLDGQLRSGALEQPFRRNDVSRAIGRSLPVAFLPKHRVGNPDGETELFQQVGRGLYRLA